MRFVPSALLLLVAMAAFTSNGVLAKDAEDVQQVESNVRILTAKNFSETVNEEGKVTMVKFYAPWCGHCRALAPEFEEAANTIDSSDVRFAKVDCTEERDLCHEHGVQGYPTLKVFRPSGTTEYRGQRKASALVSYMKKQLLPAVSVLNAETIEAFKDSDKVVIIGHFTSDEDKHYQVFKTVADKQRDDYVFGVTFETEVAKKIALKTDVPSVTVFKQFDEGRADFDGNFVEDELAEFVKNNAVPLINELGPDNFMEYMDSGKPLAYLFVTSDKERETFNAELGEVAKQHKGKVNFVFLDANQFGGHAATLNLKEEWPAFAIQDTVKMFKYPFPQDQKITKDSIRQFVADYVDGKLEPSIKSEPIPEKNDGDVMVVVADSYDQIVLDKEKDVLIEFYAPWCGHCKRLAPVYEKLGARLAAHRDKLIIAKMDATANDIPPSAGFDIEGFPTIKLVKANTNEVVDYEGDRTEEAFIAFLKEHATHKIELEDVKEEAEKEEEKKKEEEEKKEEGEDDETVIELEGEGVEIHHEEL
jgi:protein disulfide-isomerase A1